MSGVILGQIFFSGFRHALCADGMHFVMFFVAKLMRTLRVFSLPLSNPTNETCAEESEGVERGRRKKRLEHGFLKNSKDETPPLT